MLLKEVMNKEIMNKVKIEIAKIKKLNSMIQKHVEELRKLITKNKDENEELEQYGH